MRNLILSIAMVALVPAALGAQTAEAGAAARAQAATPQARIDAATQAAVRAGVPARLLASKVAEGEAKKAAPERIAAAVEARAAVLIRAAETLRGADVNAFGDAELAVAGDALEAGISQSALIRVAREAPSERRVMAVAVMTDLVRLGAAPDQALLRVDAALGSSAALGRLDAETTAALHVQGLQSTLEAAGTLRIR
jgi:hypothetical protein